MKNVTMAKRTIAAIAAATMAMSAMAATLTVSADNTATTTTITADALQNVKYTDTTVDVRQAYNAASATITYNVSGDFAFNADGTITLSFNGVANDEMTEGLVKSVKCTVKSGSTTSTIVFTGDEDLEDTDAGIVYVEDFAKLFTTDGQDFIQLDVKDFPDALTTLYKQNKNLEVATEPTKTGMIWNTSDSGWELRKAKAIDSIAVEVVLEQQTTNAPTKKELSAVGDLFEEVTLSVYGDVREYSISSNKLYVAAKYNENGATAVLPSDLQTKIANLKMLTCYADFDSYVSDLANSTYGDRTVRFNTTQEAITDYLNNGLVVEAYHAYMLDLTDKETTVSTVYDVYTKTADSSKVYKNADGEYGTLSGNVFTVDSTITDASVGTAITDDGTKHTTTITVPADGLADNVNDYWYDSAYITEAEALTQIAHINATGVNGVKNIYNNTPKDIRDAGNKTAFAQIVRNAKSGTTGPLNALIAEKGYSTLVKDNEAGYVESTDYTLIQNVSTLNTALTNVAKTIDETKELANVALNTRTDIESTVKTAVVTEARPLMVEGNMWTNIGMLYTGQTGVPLLAQLNSLVENNKGCKLVISIDPTTLPENTAVTNTGVFNNNVAAVGAARLRVNGAFALTYNDMASFDATTNTYTFDWDAVVNGKSMDATMAVWSLEFASYNPLGITGITVSVPDQESYLAAIGADKETDKETTQGGSLSVGEGREDESDELTDIIDEEIYEETPDYTEETEDIENEVADNTEYAPEVGNTEVANPDTGDTGFALKLVTALSACATTAIGVFRKRQ